MPEYRYPDARLAIFAKAPVAGSVKTRMQPALSPSESAELQRKLIVHTVNMALQSQLAPVQLWCAPDTQHPSFSHYADKLELIPQQGHHLGARMQQAFAHNRSQDFTLLIGTDCPLLTAQPLQQAAAAAAAADVALIPAEDGGYVLIGSKVQPCCFDAIDWGTEKVLVQSLSALARGGQSYQLLPALPDLDHPEDLAALPDDITRTLTAEGLRALAQDYLR